jgi:small-conductance mechanosensitive channel
VNVTGVLAVGGFSGVAVGFAAQRCVANMISGGLIFLTQVGGRSPRRPEPTAR